jgi:hypothetical protein
MAFRIEAAAFVILAGAGLLRAQDLTASARHQHWRKGGAGTLTFDPEGVRWEETGKKQEHSRTWKYEEIQRLELSPSRLRIMTYEDVRWQFGRDREYDFDDLSDGTAGGLYSFLRGRLDQRLVAHLADPAAPVFEIPAKLLHGARGANGRLELEADRIVFDAGAGSDSRLWRSQDIMSVSSSGPFELTINTIEGENRFQLKRRLPEEEYENLWRRVAEMNGLKMYRSEMAAPHQ